MPPVRWGRQPFLASIWTSPAYNRSFPFPRLWYLTGCQPMAVSSIPIRSQRTMQQSLSDQYRSVRSYTEKLCEPLEVEDYVVSSMPDVSPTKWHLAHTSWFFETFILRERDPHYVPLNPRYAYLFNSY